VRGQAFYEAAEGMVFVRGVNSGIEQHCAFPVATHEIAWRNGIINRRPAVSMNRHNVSRGDMRIEYAYPIVLEHKLMVVRRGY
jgi:hypothetical protein